MKLVEVGLHDATAGVGKVGDYEIVVAGAAKLVGKKVAVVVGRALEGVAFATVAQQAGRETPITFEAEAEKPPRPQPRKKEPVAETEVAPEVESAETTAAEIVEPSAAAEAVPEEAEGEPSPKKKRTRRGSRGGRGRKKPAAAAADESPATSEESPDDGKAGPRIHVPPPDLGSAMVPPAERVDAVDEREPEPEHVPAAEPASPDGEPVEGPKRKRSRRGSRGGRRRRKASVNGDPDDVAEVASSEEVAEVSAVAPGASEYVPMSDWIEDFESPRPG